MPTENDPFNRAQQRIDRNKAEVNRTQEECTRLYDNLSDVAMANGGYDNRAYRDADRQYAEAERANLAARKLVDADDAA